MCPGISLTFLDSVNGVVVGVCSGYWRQFPVGRGNVAHLVVREAVLPHGDDPSVPHGVHGAVELSVLLCKEKC